MYQQRPRTPWRKKPDPRLKCWTGKPNKNGKVKTILVYCIAYDEAGKTCHHNSMLKINDLPDWSWPDISAHLRCTKCGKVGWVETRANWGDEIDFNRSALGRGEKL